MVELAPAVLVPNFVHAAAVEKSQRAQASANESVLANLCDAECSLSLAVPSMVVALRVPLPASSTDYGGFVLNDTGQGPHKADP